VNPWLVVVVNHQNLRMVAPIAQGFRFLWLAGGRREPIYVWHSNKKNKKI
jgi:hypothetical protein